MRGTILFKTREGTSDAQELKHELKLRSNNLDAEAGKALAKALEVNKVLIDLNLFDNKIGPDGAKAIADALRVNAVLTTIKCALCPQMRKPHLGTCTHTFSTLAQICQYLGHHRMCLHA